MGDFGCHIFDPIFMGIQPGPPLSVRAEISGINDETWPAWEIIHYEFPGNELTVDKTIKATWYDGGKQPPRELAALTPEDKMPDTGSMVIGEEGVMILPHWAGPQFFPKEKFKGIERPKLGPCDHYHQRIDACLGEGQATANFDYSGPLTEAVLLGNVANRLAGQTLEWDAEAMRVKNVEAANALLRRTYREGWAIEGLS
jgi:hypothetical protein